MGRSIKPTYYCRIKDQDGWTDLSWTGRATDKRAEDKRIALNKSFDRGGCNFHVSEAAGYIVHVSKLIVVRNDGSGQVVAKADAPMFEVV